MFSHLLVFEVLELKETTTRIATVSHSLVLLLSFSLSLMATVGQELQILLPHICTRKSMRLCKRVPHPQQLSQLRSTKSMRISVESPRKAIYRPVAQQQSRQLCKGKNSTLPTSETLEHCSAELVKR